MFLPFTCRRHPLRFQEVSEPTERMTDQYLEINNQQFEEVFEQTDRLADEDSENNIQQIEMTRNAGGNPPRCCTTWVKIGIGVGVLLVGVIVGAVPFATLWNMSNLFSTSQMTRNAGGNPSGRCTIWVKIGVGVLLVVVIVCVALVILWMTSNLFSTSQPVEEPCEANVQDLTGISSWNTDTDFLKQRLENMKPGVTEIYLNGQNISFIPPDLFLGKQQLRTLFLRANPFNISTNRPWIRHPKLSYLDISDSDLGALSPVVFDCLPNLKVVIMAGNEGCAETQKQVRESQRKYKIMCDGNFDKF